MAQTVVQVLADIASGDPLVGNRALDTLVALGDAGEAAFLAQPIEFPHLTQHKRRLLRYVATREKTIRKPLLDRLITLPSTDNHDAVAFLLAGTQPSLEWRKEVYRLLELSFQHNQPTSETLRDYHPAWSRFLAWGYSGGDGSTLWNLIKSDEYCWDKLRVSAFRAACAFTARIDASGLWALQQFITHTWISDDAQLTILPHDWEQLKTNEAVGAGELSQQATQIFLLWRRGELADKIIAEWSQHPHPRVRAFGAEILSSLRLQRTWSPLAQWLGRETNSLVRQSILYALECIDSTPAADVLLETWQQAPDPANSSLARCGWRATDKAGALQALQDVATSDRRFGAEAVVSLARLGHASHRLSDMLHSTRFYDRLCAALAVGYLRTPALLGLLDPLHTQASNNFERLFLTAAMAIGGVPGSAIRLADEMKRVADKNEPSPIDLFQLHRFLQDALIAGLKEGGAATADHLKAWQAELEPLEPISTPVPVRLTAPELREGSAPEGRPAVPVDPLADGITLALSGGGLRATLYQLGITAYLAQHDQLREVRGIVSVSGGSILAAHLAINWPEAIASPQKFSVVAGKLVGFARSDIRHQILIPWLWSRLNPLAWIRASSSRTGRLRAAYARHFAKARLGDLAKPGFPKVAFVATESIREERIAFTATEVARFPVLPDLTKRGQQTHIIAESTGVPLSLAVATSSCFPPVFPSMRLTHRDFGLLYDEFKDELSLNDGGVIGNLGIEVLLNLAAVGWKLTTRVLIADAERRQGEKPGNNQLANLAVRSAALSQSANEIAEQRLGASVRFIRLSARRPSPPGLPFPVETKVMVYRTDLDTPSWQECQALILHGYGAAAEALGNPSTYAQDVVDGRTMTAEILARAGAKGTLPPPTEEDLVRSAETPKMKVLFHAALVALCGVALIGAAIAWLR